VLPELMQTGPKKKKKKRGERSLTILNTVHPYIVLDKNLSKSCQTQLFCLIFCDLSPYVASVRRYKHRLTPEMRKL
jgi:hypothetical protein